MASMAVISTVPDAAAISLICSSALLMNAKPFAPMKEGRDMNSNAYASFWFVLQVGLMRQFCFVYERVPYRS